MTDEPTGDGRSMKERMLAGDLYITDGEILADQVRSQELMAAYNAAPPGAADERRRLLGELLGAIGDDCEIRPPFYVDYGFNIRFGDRCFANFGLTALDVAPIDIGDDVQIATHVQLLTATHPLAPGPRRDKWESAAPIRIGDNVWLGGGVIVLPGVEIGADTVVGAGAVVTKDLPPGVLAVGSPARVVRALG